MGKVFLVGAGPGDAGLITVKGMECLMSADAVIYDRLVNDELLEHLKEGCVRIYVGKKAGKHSKNQDEINRIIVRCADEYETTVRLKGGDPFVFGRGGEEIEELNRHSISFEVIPGITSAVAVPQSAGIPITHRGLSQSFHVITGHTTATDLVLTEDFEALARLNGTLVFLMALNNLERIAGRLIENGMAEYTPAAVISNGTRPNEKTVRGTLGTVAKFVREVNLTSPALFVIGETAKLKLNPVVHKPLCGLCIGITATKVLREKLRKGLNDLGAQVYTVCDMRIKETSHTDQLAEELKAIERYQWIMFTSQNAIRIFFDCMQKFQIDHRKLSHVKFAVIGSSTRQELLKYGYYADFIPINYTTKDLAKGFTGKVSVGEKVLIPRALQGSKELTQILSGHKIDYKDIPIYDITGELTEHKNLVEEMNLLIFTSTSGVNTFFNDIIACNIRMPENINIACMGQATGEAVSKYGMKADIIARVSSAEGLIEQIKEFNR